MELSRTYTEPEFQLMPRHPCKESTMTNASPYRAPVEDYAFLYGEAFGLDLAERSTGGALAAADAIDVIAAAGEFASAVFAPLDTVGDRQGARLENGVVRLPAGFVEAYRTFVDAGWVTAEAPETAGGDGLPAVVRAGLAEIWNASNAAFALCWGLAQGQILALDATASPALRETYLTKLVSGEWTGTMNLTEPDAGTDLGAIRTLATPRDDGTWGLRGQKIFITWGDHDAAENIVHLVLARTPDAPAGARGLSLFVAPRILVNDDGTLGERNAVTTVAIERKLGIHGSPTCQLAYDDATAYLVGELHGGLAGMFVMMNAERAAMAFQATGICDRAYQQAAAYAAQRIQGQVVGRPAGATIAEHPDVRRLLLSMSSDIFAMRALGVYVAGLLDRAEEPDAGALADFFVPVLKGWATEEALRVTSDAIQVHGGMGFIEETGVAQHYRDARIMPIYEGTTAIQSNDLVGRKVLRDGGATAEVLFAQIAATALRLADFDHPAAHRISARLQRAVEAARRATDDLLGFAASPRDVYGVSVPYLMLLGTLAGAWMHALATVAVLRRGEESEQDAARIGSADFYTAHHLPRVHALAETVAAGEVA
jgi:alkylation response protein AidB-like acyl-CoA dehydrogenase